jgi:hypothetical protein
MTFHERFIEFLQARFPLWNESPYRAAQVAPLLISPHVLKLPHSVWQTVEDVVAAFDEVTQMPSYQQHIGTHDELTFNAGNRAILNSFDFHLTADFQPKLIEINTNASFALIGEALSDFQKVEHQPFSENLRHDILRELELSGIAGGAPRVTIVDDAPERQRLFAEFVFYKNLFEQWGWPTTICDTRDLRVHAKTLLAPNDFVTNFVYNRDTDFLLKDRAALKEAYMHKLACVSPNPREYTLLANKTRLIELSQPHFMSSLPEHLREPLSKSLLKTIDLGRDSNRENIWERRKEFMFKPRNLYGSKAVYRGSSISKKTFATVVTDDFIAQEFAPPNEVVLSTGDGDKSFKYDLRFYTYQKHVRFAIARLYRGQLTNFNEAEGGFAAIEWTSNPP